MARQFTHQSSDSRGAGRPMRRIVISFVIAVLAVASLVLYYSLARATITLEVAPDSMVMETILELKQYSEAGEVTGTIIETEVTQKKNFSASPSGELEDKASGYATIISTHSAAQTLIATTRLLSPQGVLFRLKETVTVPANGKLENVPVAADQAGEASAISPTRFTIPGLRPALQQVIYAESTEPMRRLPKSGSTEITPIDLDQARKSLADILVPQALAKLREQLPSDRRELNVVYRHETTKAESDVPAGSKNSQFNYTVTVKVTAVFYDQDELREHALTKLQADLSSGRKILNLEPESLAVNIDSVAGDLTSSLLKVKFLAQVIITDPDLVFPRRDLLGRSEEEVQNYFSGIPGVKNVTVDLWPFWVKSIPTVEDHATLKLAPS